MKEFIKFIALILVLVISTTVFLATLVVGLQKGIATGMVEQASLEKKASLYPASVANEHFNQVYEQAQSMRRNLSTGPLAPIARAHAIVKILLAAFSFLVAAVSIAFIGDRVKKSITGCKEAKRLAEEKIASASRAKREQMHRENLIREAKAAEAAEQLRLQKRRAELIAQFMENDDGN
ncbi:MAG: hypothetical protein IKV94_02475 [Clostridia bacterium]|nr:hypothetical protein [Clostridia bacterium]